MVCKSLLGFAQWAFYVPKKRRTMMTFLGVVMAPFKFSYKLNLYDKEKLIDLCLVLWRYTNADRLYKLHL